VTKTIPSRAIVTTVPFGTIDALPLRRLAEEGVELVINPLNRKLKESEVADVIRGFPVVIAGTESITAATMESCPGLKAICRVGIGLDSVDLLAARRLGIAVSYTPDGPSPAAAELAMGLILDLLRGIGPADRGLRQGKWTRTTGARIATSTIGVIGCGRIGGRVIRHLVGGFPGVRVLAHDLDSSVVPDLPGVEAVSLERVLAESDVVTLHVPLTAATRNLIADAELAAMKPSAALVNTARGGIVDEAALARALRSGVLRAAAVDVFIDEPYVGELTQLDNVVLTCHMGSMTADCRARMEIEATEEAIRFLKGQPFLSPVPEDEYTNAELMAAR
jgi:D-3-phosphoglycerate dehydrogenase / 2-oxoglutarate reductase